MVLILGGARSGRSALAERLTARSGRSVAFIATATASDYEMRERIASPRASRRKGWETIEDAADLGAAVRQASELADVLLLDCVTLWLGNVLSQESGQHERDDEGEEFYTTGKLFDERALQEIETMLGVVKSLGPNKMLIAITNEVGLGIVPAYPLGRLYRDTLGYVNQRLAQAADPLYLMAPGVAVDIKHVLEEAFLYVN